MNYVMIFIVTFISFFAVDLIWLGIVAKNLYQKHLGYLLASPPNWPVAIAFYLLYIVGIIIFVLVPALDRHSLNYALLYGCLFGFFTYMTYDLTNWSTIKDWPWIISVIDIIWGSALGTLVSAISYLVLTKVFKF